MTAAIVTAVGAALLFVVAQLIPKIVDRDYEYIADHLTPALVSMAAMLCPRYVRSLRKQEWLASLGVHSASYGITPISYFVSTVVLASRERLLDVLVVPIYLGKRALSLTGLRRQAEPSAHEAQKYLDSVKIRIDIDDPPGMGEWVWARSVGENRYVVKNHVFFSDDVQYGDIVCVSEERPRPRLLHYRNTIKYSEMLILRSMAKTKFGVRLRQVRTIFRLQNLGASCESMMPGAFGVAIPYGQEVEAAVRMISDGTWASVYVPGRPGCLGCGVPIAEPDYYCPSCKVAAEIVV